MKHKQDLPLGLPQWTLGDRLRKARTWAGLERIDLADDIGCSDRTISNYELDATRVPKLVVRQYALRCQVPVEWLETGRIVGSDRPEGTTVQNSECYPVDLVAA